MELDAFVLKLWQIPYVLGSSVLGHFLAGKWKAASKPESGSWQDHGSATRRWNSPACMSGQTQETQDLVWNSESAGNFSGAVGSDMVDGGERAASALGQSECFSLFSNFK